MIFDKRTNRALFMFFLFLNFSLRYFLLGNHEEGSDSFLIHNLANTISEFGYAKWIIHPLSYFGLTPLSYPCAVPYLLSGIAQLTGFDMEYSILVFSFIVAFIAFTSAYLMAMEIKRDHMFAFIVAFIYSLSPIFVQLSLWQATTRSLFIGLLPLLIWTLLRSYGDRSDKAKNIFLAIIIFTILGTIHHMFLIMPLFIIAYFSSAIIYNRIKRKPQKEHWIFRNQTAVITGLFLLFFLPQFTHQGIYSTVSWKTYETGLFFTGTDFQVIIMNMLIDYWSRAGFFAFLGILGLFTMIHKPRKKGKSVFERYKLEKSYSEIFILVCLLITIPFVTMGIYVSLIFLPFFSVIIGFGVIKVFHLVKRNKSIFKVFFVSFILISLGFCIFMNDHWDNSVTNQPVTEHTYATGIYVAHHFDNTSIVNNGLMSNRIHAISGVPSLPLGGANVAWYPPELLVYGFTDVEDYTFSRLSFDVVILTQSDFLYTTEYGINAKEDWVSVMNTNVNDPKVNQMQTRYNFEQAIEYMPQEKQFFFWSIRDSSFYISMDETKYVLYNNGEHRIWQL